MGNDIGFLLWKKNVDKISFQKNESSTRLFGTLEYIRIFSRFFMWLYFSPWKRILDEIYASKDYVTDTIWELINGKPPTGMWIYEQ